MRKIIVESDGVTVLLVYHLVGWLKKFGNFEMMELEWKVLSNFMPTVT